MAVLFTVSACSTTPDHAASDKRAVIGEVETAEEAVALLLEPLPIGLQPIITAPTDEHV
ncbi:hypothetical protein [Streptomyces sp. IBSBF 2806]|uniref:hypothetical protein n=1 Tax=Streptomyces sp. IBSBF 2806 TaxID=2903529 RepID=UPI002FDC5AC5